MRGRRFKTKNKNTLPDTLFKTKIFKKQKNHKVGNAQKVIYDGIQFQSGLEKNMYIILVENGFTIDKDFFYEKAFATLLEPFKIENNIWVNKKSTKTFGLDSKSVRNMIYTPDFVQDTDLTKTKWIVETKGRANERWGLVIKLFKLWLSKNNPTCVMYIPANKTQCEETIKKILEYESSS